MRLLKAECKRVMKTRAVWFLLAAAFLLSFVMAYFPKDICWIQEFII